jgi:YVTN family beta-propeller protein
VLRRAAWIVGAIVIAGCSSAGSRVSTTGLTTTDPTALHEPTTVAGRALSIPPPTPTPSDPPTSSTPTTSSTTTTVTNVYHETAVGDLSPAVGDAKAYVYVPSNDTGTVTVIDQRTKQIVDHYYVGRLVQHVVTGWDLHTLYATASDSNRLVPIDPATGRPSGAAIRVDAPYNLYFTPDGSTAIVMAERRNRIDLYDRATWRLRGSVHSGCDGPNHADWSANGSWFAVTCEYSGQILTVDSRTGAVIKLLSLGAGAMPQDIRLTPSGDGFYVADMGCGCVRVLDSRAARQVASIPTGVGAHGIYPSRDGKRMYVSNRGRTAHDVARPSHEGEGSVSVIDPATNTVVATWSIPGGGSPDMGGVSADGRELWLSGRYDSVVYVFDTATGALTAKIPVPSGPHGLNVFPQPGRYSLGHTGNYR